MSKRIELAACASRTDIFFDASRVFDAVGFCNGCAAKLDCAQSAMDDMYIDDAGNPVAWLVRGGLTPRSQERLWHESIGGADIRAIEEAVL